MIDRKRSLHASIYMERISQMDKQTIINDLKAKIFSSANHLLLNHRRMSKEWAEGFEAALGVLKKELEKAMKETS